MMLAKHSTFLISIIFSCILSACGPTAVHQSGTGNLAYTENLLSSINADAQENQKHAQILLSESAVSVSESLKKLAEIERAVHPEAKFPVTPQPEKIGMANLASVDWTGPVEPLLKKLAQSSHYTLNIIGKKPTIPLLIAINKQNIPVAHIVRDVSYQIQRNATIKIYAKHKQIELQYH
ncbi:MAG: LuxR family transcriptional regulator [Legionellales bacterium]|nr:LuxR family transcriptional regulator [Legionellales bacterium]|tara:strand:+ start:1250 stop:1786 length:537 start_codon:yes stop_codon:yes gene_type:complete